MKNVLTTLLIFICYFLSAQNKSNQTINTSSIIKYRVLIKDTTRLKNILKSLSPEDAISDYNNSVYFNYLNTFSYNKFYRLIKKNIYSSNSVIGDKNGGVIYNKSNIKNIIQKCDSTDILGVDEDGNGVMVKAFACDSIWTFDNIKAIDFTETWTIDFKTLEFKKNVLAIDLVGYQKSKENLSLISLFTIYKDEASHEKIKNFFKK